MRQKKQRGERSTRYGYFKDETSGSAFGGAGRNVSDRGCTPAVTPAVVFSDISSSAGIELTAVLTESVCWGDYDNDGDPDLYLTNQNVANNLFRNDGGGSFTDVTSAAGVGDASWGVGCAFGDVDNDGWEDFFVTNGFDATSSANVLFRNNQDGTFSDVTAAIGGGAFDGRGVAFADFDLDGDLDLIVTADAGQPNKLWENISNNGFGWVTLKLVGTNSNRTAFGARIEVTTDLMTVVKEVSGGAGRGSFNDPPVEFGLGSAATIQQVIIRWPNGLETVHPNLAINQFHTIVEPLQATPTTTGWGVTFLALVILLTGTLLLREPRRRGIGSRK